MIGIKVDDQFLDIDADTSIRFTLENPLFLSDNSTLIPGSYSRPFNLPDTPTNRRLLNYPTEIDNASFFQIDRDAQFCFCGVFLWNATLTIKKSSNKRYKAYMIINPLEDLSQITLPELKEDVRSVGNEITQPTIVDHANDTLVNPQDYDYLFLPVYNRCIVPVPDNVNYLLHQNFYDVVNQTFVESPEMISATPFIKFDYVLRCIFDRLGIEMLNNPLVGEKANLVIYNNQSIVRNTNGDWWPAINIPQHLPNCTAAEFLREFMRVFGLVPMVSLRGNTVEFKSIEDLLDSTPSKDWTSIAGEEYQICESINYIDKICYEECSSDKLEDRKGFPIGDVGYYTLGDPIPPGSILNYDLYEMQWYFSGAYSVDGQTITEPLIVHHDKPCVVTGDQGETLSLKIQPTYQAYHFSIDFALQFTLPHININNNLQAMDQEAEIPKIKMMLYRGMFSNTVTAPGGGNSFTYTFPLTSTSNVVRDLGRVGDCSLNLVGPDGIFETSWKNSLSLYSKSRTIETTVCLTLADVLSFDFCEKIRYLNRNYLVRSLDITFTNKGIRPSKAKLVHTQ